MSSKDPPLPNDLSSTKLNDRLRMELRWGSLILAVLVALRQEEYATRCAENCKRWAWTSRRARSTRWCAPSRAGTSAQQVARG